MASKQAARWIAAPREPFELRQGSRGKGIFALYPISRGARLFGPDEFADEAERASFIRLPLDAFARLPAERCAIFIRYAYNVAPDVLSGTFDWAAARHPSNFINHSCDPNAGYDGSPADNIVAKRDIAAGEEICMDYGTCTIGFDQDFACGCGAASCRGRVRGDDWQRLARAGVPLPSFMAPLVALQLTGAGAPLAAAGGRARRH
ncbi:MAG TPA: SET domain-containing protein [Alphaproteobacteria bacterium]|nr:SET domain-containing protein [Alphaproteobacteria bacterium]